MDNERDAPGDARAAATVPIRLRTSLAQSSVPYVPYMVPVTWRRAQLSTLVNKLLAVADGAADRKPVPFDFIVNGELLRCGLDEFLAQHDLSREVALELEYIRSTLPPSFRDAAKEDDYIASIDATRDGVYLTASFDGHARVHRADALREDPLVYAPPHGDEPVSLTCARWLSDAAVLTGSLTGALSAWRIPDAAPGAQVPVLQTLSLRHHTAAITTLDVARDASAAASAVSASWDGTVALWHVPEVPGSSGAAPAHDSADDAAPKRRRVRDSAKRASGSGSAEPAPLVPTTVLTHVPPSVGAAAARALGAAPVPGTNARTYAAHDPRAERVYSAAWDGSVKAWDLAAGGVLAGQKSSDKVPLCLDALRAASSGPQLVTGHMDHSLALYDFRDTVSSALAIAHAHAAPVGAVCASATTNHQFVSGAYDGRLKMWDVRSPKQPLFALAQPSATTGDGDVGRTKILALAWTRDGSIVAGGEDCRLSVYEAAEGGGG
ncbi:ribosome biogenesis protein ytm1 [Malassezia sp. CBS 17886]|nr:ribosome biogenesis protein ytm1 [Malassezia sp. CBS 17886]